MDSKYIIDHWSQVTILIALITGCIGYLFNLFFSNRDKIRHSRYEIFQEKKLNAYVDFNTIFIEMTFLTTSAINLYDVDDFQNNVLSFNLSTNEFYRKTTAMHSYLNSETFSKYDKLYNKVMKALKDMTEFSSGITSKVINLSNDKYAMQRLQNYILDSILDATEDFEKLKKEFQIYYRD